MLAVVELRTFALGKSQIRFMKGGGGLFGAVVIADGTRNVTQPLVHRLSQGVGEAIGEAVFRIGLRAVLV